MSLEHRAYLDDITRPIKYAIEDVSMRYFHEEIERAEQAGVYDSLAGAYKIRLEEYLPVEFNGEKFFFDAYRFPGSVARAVLGEGSPISHREEESCTLPCRIGRLAELPRLETPG
jgi:hypothetical protein